MTIDEVLARPCQVDRRDERRSWFLHHAVMTKLAAMNRDELADARALARANIAKMRTKVRSPLAHRWLDQWSGAVEAPLVDLARFALVPGEEGADLRQMSPWAGVLTQDERLAAIAASRQ